VLEQQPHRAQMRPQLQQARMMQRQQPPWQHGRRLVSPKATSRRSSRPWPSAAESRCLLQQA
jgi:hypothetical protein